VEGIGEAKLDAVGEIIFLMLLSMCVSMARRQYQKSEALNRKAASVSSELPKSYQLTVGAALAREMKACGQ